MTSRVADSILELIGNTPMVKLSKMVSEEMAEIFVKLEAFNPAGSVKDRIALNMVEEAEGQGVLKPGNTIVEATSGNTGIGLAMVAAAKGYNLILVMPDTMSIERRNLLKAYGAELKLTLGAEGMKGAIAKAEELVEKNSDYFMPRQFENIANPQVHSKTTAKEIMDQTNKKLDAFVAGVGTGGTVTGVGEVLKNEIGNINIIGVEPIKSSVLSGGKPGSHKIQGIGAGFVPQILNLEMLDRIVKVEDRDAYKASMELAQKEGILVGISAGAALVAGMEVARELGKGKRVVILLPDTGERYLSMAEHFDN
ncbi:cysteine synthase A [Desulfitispora alkaliphila]|uniref:cysteine synthase A n=1 Tax=Desulfitispora alkaliphila TaxID=622674 RepID=UPI003D1C9805